MSKLTEKVEKIFQFLLLEGCKKYHGGRCTDNKHKTSSRTLTGKSYIGPCDVCAF